MGKHCINCGKKQNKENEKYQQCRDCYVQSNNKHQTNQTKQELDNHNKTNKNKGLEINLKNPIVSFIAGCIITWILMTIT